MTKHDELIAESGSWRRELAAQLRNHGGDDLVAPYSQVARAFPSVDPNPRSFDEPLIASQELKHWAEENGWHVELTQDMQANDGYQPVRFVKLRKA